jgi:hypothetical protein
VSFPAPLALNVLPWWWKRYGRRPLPGKMKPHAALQSVLAFQVRYGVPFIWCGNRAGAEYATFYFFRHYLREAQERLKAVVGVAPAKPGTLQLLTSG